MNSQYFVECFCEYCTLIKKMNPVEENSQSGGDRDFGAPMVTDNKDVDSDTDTLTRDGCHGDDMSELMARNLFEDYCVFGDYRGVFEVAAESDDDIPQSQNNSCGSNCGSQPVKDNMLCISCGSKNHDKYHCGNPFKTEKDVKTQIKREVCGCSCQNKCSYVTGVGKPEMDIGGLENADYCLAASHRVLPVLPHRFLSSHQSPRVRDCCDVTCSSKEKEADYSGMAGIRVFPTEDVSVADPCHRPVGPLGHSIVDKNDAGGKRIVIASSICKQTCAAYSYMKQYLGRKFQSCHLCNIPLHYTPERWILLDEKQKSKPIYGLLCDNCVESLRPTHVVKVRLKYGVKDFIHVRYVGNI